jgi:hypothetical protein
VLSRQSNYKSSHHEYSKRQKKFLLKISGDDRLGYFEGLSLYRKPLPEAADAVGEESEVA